MSTQNAVNMEYATEAQSRNLQESKTILASATTKKTEYETKLKNAKSTGNSEELVTAYESLIFMQNAVISRQNQRIEKILAGIAENEKNSVKQANYAALSMLPEYVLKLGRKQAEYEELARDILELQEKISKLQAIETSMMSAVVPAKK